MFRSILVPLDRSLFAEQALPLAACIARRANARLDLVKAHSQYALENPHAAWGPYDACREADWAREEQRYLTTTARKVAHNARVSAARRTRREGIAAVPESVPPMDAMTGRELVAALDEAVSVVLDGAQSPQEALNAAATKWDEITREYGMEKQKAAYEHGVRFRNR